MLGSHLDVAGLKVNVWAKVHKNLHTTTIMCSRTVFDCPEVLSSLFGLSYHLLQPARDVSPSLGMTTGETDHFAVHGHLSQVG